VTLLSTSSPRFRHPTAKSRGPGNGSLLCTGSHDPTKEPTQKGTTMHTHPIPVHLASGHLMAPPGTGPRARSSELSRSRAAARRHAVAEGLRPTIGDES
jgi:hypothetical protein